MRPTWSLGGWGDPSHRPQSSKKGRPALASSRHSSNSTDQKVTVAAFLQKGTGTRRSSIGIDGADGETSLIAYP